MQTRTRLAAAAGATALAALPATVVAASYVVHPGDTLGDIAVRHGTTVAALAGVNGISDGEALRPGTLLQIPDASLGLPAYARGGADVETYRLRAGEGVFQVARHFGVDATALARLNGIGVNAPLTPGAEVQVPGRLVRANALLTHVAGEAGADASLVRAVGWVESAWRQETISPTGAVGIMQLEPFTGEWVSRHLAGRRLDIWLARDNVLAGSLLLQHLHTAHDGSTAATLAAYYQGDASVAAHGLYGDTQRYLERVLRLIALDG